MVDSIPQGFSSITPHIVIKNCSEALEFYKKAFNATEIYQSKAPDGRVMHAMIQIGNSFVMMADEFPEMGAVGPATLGGTSFALHIYTENAESLFKMAIDAGATQLMPVTEMFWGDKYGQLQDIHMAIDGQLLHT